MTGWFASPHTSGVVGNASHVLGVVLLFAAAAACDSEPPVQQDHEAGVSSVSPREPKTFAPTGSFDGPHQNQHNWVEMSLGEDEDGDGVRELVIARPIDKSTNTTVAEAQGMVYVLRGGSLEQRRTVPSDEPHTFGYGVASMGDVDGDGVMDIAVGAPVHAEDMGREGWGTTYGYLSGSEGASWEVRGNDEIDDFGHSLAFLGGKDNILVASASRFLGGYAVGINALTGEVLFKTASSVLDNDTVGERRGYHVVGLSDLTGDGLPDFLMTASGQDRKNPFFDYEGRVYIHDGSNGALLGVVEGATSGDQLGTYATTIKDVDGDGRDELLIGSGYESRSEHVSGVAYLLRTGPLLDADPAVWTVDDPKLLIREHVGRDSVELMGFTVAQAPDMDADGVFDYAVGAPGCSTDTLKNAGCVHIYSGATGAELQVMMGDEAGYWFGEFLVTDLEAGRMYVGTKDWHKGTGRVDAFEARSAPERTDAKP